jgi:hypothetical protein
VVKVLNKEDRSIKEEYIKNKIENRFNDEDYDETD